MKHFLLCSGFRQRDYVGDENRDLCCWSDGNFHGFDYSNNLRFMVIKKFHGFDDLRFMAKKTFNALTKPKIYDLW